MTENIERTNINEDVVKLEMIDASIRLACIKELIPSIKGSLILERVVCSNCMTMVNPW